MIEHDMEFIGKLCDEVVVMAEGSVLATDSIEAIKANPDVIEAYLGRGMKNKSWILVTKLQRVKLNDLF